MIQEDSNTVQFYNKKETVTEFLQIKKNGQDEYVSCFTTFGLPSSDYALHLLDLQKEKQKKMEEKALSWELEQKKLFALTPTDVRNQMRIREIQTCNPFFADSTFPVSNLSHNYTYAKLMRDEQMQSMKESERKMSEKIENMNNALRAFSGCKIVTEEMIPLVDQQYRMQRTFRDISIR